MKMFENIIVKWDYQKKFWKKMRPEIQLRMHNMLSEPAGTYGSEMWVLRSQDQKMMKQPRQGS
jgi:hypothetical protein